MKLLLLGATGLVGSRTLALALSSDAVSGVIAPTRSQLAPSGKLVNPVAARLEELLPLLEASRPDAIICALGTTRAKAGSKEAFRHVDHALPMAFARAAHAAGTQACAIVSAMGASPGAASFYYRTKGELETDIRGIGFRSLTICRPSLIDGRRHEARAAEGAALALLRFVAPVLPKRFHASRDDAIAAALLDAVVAARTGCRRIDAQEIC